MIAELRILFAQVQINVPFVLHLLALAWGVQVVNMLLGYRLNILGILPRVPVGLLGVVFSPLLHGNLSHIFMNSFFFFALSLIVLLEGKALFWVVTANIVLLSGVLVWLFARRALHVGASSLVVGYWSFSVAMAYFHPSLAHFIGAAVGIFYFGTDLLASLLPQGKKVSVEGHLAGFAAGIVTALYFPEVKLFWMPFLHRLGLV